MMPLADHDSRPETEKHIQEVQKRLGRVIEELAIRSREHDLSKFESPEKEIFDEYTAKLAATVYGSDEYKANLAAMKPALDHHYAVNSHHPEHYGYLECTTCGHPFPRGYTADCLYCGSGHVVLKPNVAGMSLYDLVEMLCDWKAATLRHNDGDIRRSIEINQKRFGYSDELKQIFLNSLAVLGGDA